MKGSIYLWELPVGLSPLYITGSIPEFWVKLTESIQDSLTELQQRKPVRVTGVCRTMWNTEEFCGTQPINRDTVTPCQFWTDSPSLPVPVNPGQIAPVYLYAASFPGWLTKLHQVFTQLVGKLWRWLAFLQDSLDGKKFLSIKQIRCRSGHWGRLWRGLPLPQEIINGESTVIYNTIKSNNTKYYNKIQNNIIKYKII